MGRTVAQSAPKLTYEHLLLFPDDGKRHELIDGEHFVSAAPNPRHQRVLSHLGYILFGFVEEHRLGHVYFVPLDVVLSPHDVVEPDLIFVSNERLSLFTATNLSGAPDLAAEVLSPSSRRRDELLKRDLYERAGVSEYWVVDPEAETIKIFRRQDERFGRVTLLTLVDSDRIATPLLPGLEIPLAVVFAD